MYDLRMSIVRRWLCASSRNNKEVIKIMVTDNFISMEERGCSTNLYRYFAQHEDLMTLTVVPTLAFIGYKDHFGAVSKMAISYKLASTAHVIKCSAPRGVSVKRPVNFHHFFLWLRKLQATTSDGFKRVIVNQ